MADASDVEDRRTHWDERYGALGVENVSWYEHTPRLSIAMFDVAGARPGDAVIDVGGGASGFSGELVRRGATDVSVLDTSPAALTAARSRLDDPDAVEWIHADLLAWTPTRRWDVWHDRAVFHFLVDGADRATYRQRLRDALAPGGAVLLAAFAEDGPTSCSGLAVRRYTPEGLIEEIGEGYDDIARGRFVHRTPSGGDQPLSWAVLRQRTID